MPATAKAQHHSTPADALDIVEEQDKVITDLLASWRRDTSELERGDSVTVRWERGSVAKLLLQYFALRESGIAMVAGHLRDRGHDDLAELLDADGVTRRQAIDRLDESVRGLQAINANTPEITDAIERLGQLFDREVKGDRLLLPELARLLGPSGQRGLASARHVRTHSPTHPSPVPRWHDRIGPLQALRALYDHLRGSPSGATKPDVDRGREHTPGLRG